MDHGLAIGKPFRPRAGKPGTPNPHAFINPGDGHMSATVFFDLVTPSATQHHLARDAFQGDGERRGADSVERTMRKRGFCFAAFFSGLGKRDLAGHDTPRARLDRSALPRPALVALGLLIAGCSGSAIHHNGDLGALRARLEAGTLETGPLPASRFLELAIERHPLVLTGELDALSQRNTLEGLRSRALPRIDLQPRLAESPFVVAEDDYYGLSAPVRVQWDPMSLWTGKYAELAGNNLTRVANLRLALARKTAASELLELYYGYWMRHATHQALVLEHDRAAATLREQRAQLALGRVAPAEVAELTGRVAQQGATAAQTAKGLEDLRRAIARTLGRVSPVELLEPPHPLDIPQAALGYGVEECRARSGLSRIDALLLENADWLVAAARLEKWARFRIDFSVGNVLRWDSAFIELLLSWMIPIIDQGDAQRREVAAELEAIRYLVSRKQELDTFAETLAALGDKVAESGAALELLAQDYADPLFRGAASAPEQAASRAHKEARRAQARYRHDLARLHLLAFCEPNPEYLVDALESRR